MSSATNNVYMRIINNISENYSISSIEDLLNALFYYLHVEPGFTECPDYSLYDIIPELNLTKVNQ